MHTAPRRASFHVATGESMPDDSRLTTRPELPTGSPPTPGSERAYTYAAFCTTSTPTVTSGFFILTDFSGCAAHSAEPMIWFMSIEPVAKSVWLRRAATLNVSNSPASAIAASAASVISSRSRSHLKPHDTRATPGTLPMTSAASFAVVQSVPSRKNTHKRPAMRWITTTGKGFSSASRFLSNLISNADRLCPLSPISW